VLGKRVREGGVAHSGQPEKGPQKRPDTHADCGQWKRKAGHNRRRKLGPSSKGQSLTKKRKGRATRGEKHNYGKTEGVGSKTLFDVAGVILNGAREVKMM